MKPPTSPRNEVPNPYFLNLTLRRTRTLTRTLTLALALTVERGRFIQGQAHLPQSVRLPVWHLLWLHSL